MTESQNGKPEVSSQAELCLSSLWVPMSHRRSDTWGTPARAQCCRHHVNKGWLMSPGWAAALAEFPPNLGSSKDPALPAPPQAPLFTELEESLYFWHLWLTIKCTWNKPMDSKVTRTVQFRKGVWERLPGITVRGCRPLETGRRKKLQLHPRTHLYYWQNQSCSFRSIFKIKFPFHSLCYLSALTPHSAEGWKLN